jgi:thioredoxin-like negative regulator of GroEL
LPATIAAQKNGKLVDQVTGALPEQELTRLLEEFA